MPDISLSIHLHQPSFPRAFHLDAQDHGPLDETLGDIALEKISDLLLRPLLQMLRPTLDAIDMELALGLSGNLLNLLESGNPALLSSCQDLWQHPSVKMIPQPFHRTAQVVSNRAAWISDIERYQKMLRQRGAHLSATLQNPGYLFIRYLSWPLEEAGISSVIVDGDGFGWSGKWANRISRVSFQHSFRVLTRNSGWSNRLESLEGIDQGPIRLATQFLEELRSAGEEPVVLSIDLRKWLSRPALISDGMTLLQLLLTRGNAYGVEWVSPDSLLQRHPVTGEFDPTDWVVRPEAEGLLGRHNAHPVAADVIGVWDSLQASGADPDPAWLDEAWMTIMDQPERLIPGTSLSAGQIYARLMRLFSDMKERLHE